MSEPFTLVTWNLFQGLHHPPKQRGRLQNLLIQDHLASLDADVLVLPEAWLFDRPDATWAEELADSLGYELHQWISDNPSRTKERTRWRMVIMTRIPCRRLDDHVMPRFEPFGQRAFVRVQLDSGVTIAGAHIYGIHLMKLGNLRGWHRERKELGKVAAVSDVVAGDMNMWSPVVRRDTPMLRPAVQGRTFTSTRPHSQIDHVMVSDRIEVVSGEVLPYTGSDHLGLRTTLALR